MAKLRAFTMPKWGIEMTEGTLAEWMVAEGEDIAKGGTICLIETAKITNEVEAEYAATVRRVIAQPAEELPVGALLAVFDDGADASEEEVDAFVASFVPATGGTADGRLVKEEGRETPPPAPQEQPAAGEPDPADSNAQPGRARIDTNRAISPQALRLAEVERLDLADVTGSGRGGRITFQDVQQAVRGPNTAKPRGPAPLPPEDAIFASPLARRIAALHGIALSTLTGTGRRGRICKSDVLAKVENDGDSAERAAPFRLIANDAIIVPFDKIRTMVAKRLTAAKQDIPHFYLRMQIDAGALLEMRRAANLLLGCKATINDFLVMAAARALAHHRDVNVQLHGSDLHQFAHADVAIAVAGEKGLTTPIIRQADRMRIDQIAAATRDLVARANSGSLRYEEMDGGTFTISNLGMFGIDSFDAIINPPQGAILAVGQTSRVAVETASGEVAFADRMHLTLSVDHRAIDGAAAARFLQTFKRMLEDPEHLFGNGG
ncbi:2-oxo acid dehydrogenase subunit E2 [Croceicoccus sp. F390]|uniref:Dihydrolipoamide acetyltransferase component of pyruvate dehydrogenase complex n=1 Tax=Croceicoccus esteveae TaxID=3075597 RepID=A0ABU2ZHD0_9SPHN|nr:2-oxo acid dehydrogenase subunit E2 [Croceicoccus sp. F390]MDT0576010.1 2-oxo acid dehydrogenase subunit E2 [Croceicoccus sp. F390]